MFNCLESLYVYFSHPTNNTKFCEIQKKLGIKETSLTRISDTRWNCRLKNCRAVKQNYQAIIQLLNAEVDIAMNRDVSQAIGNTYYIIYNNLLYSKYIIIVIGILATIKSTKFIINLFILEEVLQLANILSTKFQQKSVTLGKTVNLIEGMIDTFEQNRSNKIWTELWIKINEFMIENGLSIDSSNDAESGGFIIIYFFHIFLK